MKGCVLVLVLVLVLGLSEGRISTFSRSGPDKFLVLNAPFGIGAEGGIVSVTVNATIMDPGDTRCFYVSLYGETQFKLLRQHYLRQQSCFVESYFRFEFCGKKTAHLNFSRKITKGDWYYLVLSNCFLEDISLAGEVDITLGSGDKLSANEIPLASIYYFTSIINFILFLVVILSFILYYVRTGLTGVPLQKVLILTVIFNFGASVANMIYYRDTNGTGVDDSMQENLRHVLRVAADGCLIGVTLLAALGHKILHPTLPLRAKQLFWGSFFVYLLLDFLYEFCSSPLSFCSAYMLSFFVIKFLVTLGVLVVIVGKVDRLQSDLLDISVHMHHVVYPKIRLYQSMSFVVMLFLALPVFFVVMGVTVLSWSSKTAVNTLVQEGIFFFMCTFYFIIFFPSERTNTIIFRYVTYTQIIDFWVPAPDPPLVASDARDAREALVGGEENGEDEEEEEGEEEDGGGMEEGMEMGGEGGEEGEDLFDLDKDIEEEMEEF